MHENRSFDNPDMKGRDLFLEGWWGCPRLGLILIAMPRAGDAAIDDASFP
jgi:hypothetical protein